MYKTHCPSLYTGSPPNISTQLLSNMSSREAALRNYFNTNPDFVHMKLQHNMTDCAPPNHDAIQGINGSGFFWNEAVATFNRWTLHGSSKVQSCQIVASTKIELQTLTFQQQARALRKLQDVHVQWEDVPGAPPLGAFLTEQAASESNPFLNTLAPNQQGLH